MWKCKKCGGDDFIGRYSVSTKSFDWHGDPDTLDFEIEDYNEVRCETCNSKAYELKDIATYIDEDDEK